MTVTDNETPVGVARTNCIVVGCPAGVVLAYLLARDGVPVTLLESHRDVLAIPQCWAGGKIYEMQSGGR